jgi:hypothetical protein
LVGASIVEAVDADATIERSRGHYFYERCG